MSARRLARARGQVAHSDGLPPLLASRTHPGWADADTVATQLGHLLRPIDQGRLSMHPRSLYGVLLNRWASENGFADTDRADWHLLRMAGLFTDSPRTDT